MKALQDLGSGVTNVPGTFADLIGPGLRQAAGKQMDIVSCAEEVDLTSRHPFRVDASTIADPTGFGPEVSAAKIRASGEPADASERDIGMYDSCLFGCQYCYATEFPASKENYQRHDPRSPSLIGWRLAGVCGGDR